MMGRVLVVLAMLSACAGNEETAAERCNRVRDKVVDLRLANAAQVDREAHRKTLRAALGEQFIDSCRTSMSTKQQRCVLGAADLEAATACTASR